MLSVLLSLYQLLRQLDSFFFNLKGDSKIKGKLIAIAIKSEKEEHIGITITMKGKKQRNYSKNEARKITLQGVKDKSPILLSQYRKNL